MALPTGSNVYRSVGRLCVNATDFSTPFPHGGTALGTAARIILDPGIDSWPEGAITAEEYGNQAVDILKLPQNAVLTASIRGDDNEAKQVFWETVAGDAPATQVIASLGTQIDITGSTITRSTGSWITDGYREGMAITIALTASNDGTYVCKRVEASVLTVAETLVTELTIVGGELFNGFNRVITLPGANRAGRLLSQDALKVTFSAFRPSHPSVHLYRAIPLVDSDATLALRLVQESGYIVNFVGIKNAAGNIGEIGPLEDLTI